MKETQAIVRYLEAGHAFHCALATLVSVEGSSYRRPGARLLLSADGSRVGSISGGCLEEDVVARAQRVLSTGVPERVVYDTTSENDLVWGVGMGCHGVVHVLIERISTRPHWATALAANFVARRPTVLAVTHGSVPNQPMGTALADSSAVSSRDVFVQTIMPPTRLCIFGAGDDAQPLSRLGAELGWQVTIADPRPAFATAARFPNADRVLSAPASSLVAQVDIDPDTLAVVMTHHYIHDVPILRDLLPRPLAYLGLLGPRKRAERILADLASQGPAPTPEQRARLHAPVGLDLGAEGPEQVALSIVAEIQSILTGRTGTPLKQRNAPIHEPHL